jgi:hypothetical protein
MGKENTICLFIHNGILFSHKRRIPFVVQWVKMDNKSDAKKTNSGCSLLLGDAKVD